jgi:polysaccharide biosynthesis protein PslH
MNLLVVYPYIPYPLDRGAFYRGFHLLRELARDHEVDWLAMSENQEGAEHQDLFRSFCRKVELVPFQHPPWPKLIPQRLLNPLPSTVAHWTWAQAGQMLDRMLAERRYDAVHILDIILAQYFPRRRLELPLVVDRTRVDLQYQIMERQRMRLSWKARLLTIENLIKLWAYERRVARRVQCQVVCGPDDESFLRTHVRRHMNICTIPNGVDTGYFHPEATPEESRSVHPTILFCGAMDYNPNVDALRWYFGEMHKALVDAIPDLRLFIVGKNPGPEVRACGLTEKVVVTGAVPDVRPYYRRAWLQIVPLRIGGGTRLKIVESLAMGTPVISTSIGAQGLDLRHERDILLADSPSLFVQMTVRALREPAVRERLEQHGLQTVRSRLSWPRLGKQLSDLYSARFQAQPPPHPSRSRDDLAPIRG